MPYKGKKVLILGNGFDLAHKLPTNYYDFLDFCKLVSFIYDANISYSQFHNNLNKLIEQVDIKNTLGCLFVDRVINSNAQNDGFEFNKVTINEKMDLLYKCINNNVWINYFMDIYESNLTRGEKWVDFESELSDIIKYIDLAHISLYQEFGEISQTPEKIPDHFGLMHKNDRIYCEKIGRFFADFVKADKWNASFKTIKELRNILYCDLEKVILAIDYYIYEFVEKIHISTKLDFIDKLSPDYVITFNYSNTFEKYYSDSIPVCHIHGRCSGEMNIEKNDMVLGIDEYVSDDMQFDRVDFAIFKKYIQRIRKRNDTRYAFWIDEINQGYLGADDTWSCVNVGDRTKRLPDRVSEVYIFGHSLDISDEDVLKRYINSDATAIYVYSKDKESEGELLERLLEYIKKEKIIKKSTTQPTRFSIITCK